MRSQWAKQWKLSAQTCPHMSKVAHGRVLVSQNGAESYRGQSSWSVVFRGQPAVLVLVVSRSSWMVFIFYGGYAHVFTETYSWGKPRSMSGQMYGWVGRTRVGGQETRPKPKPNVDYYLVSYLLLLFLLLL